MTQAPARILLVEDEALIRMDTAMALEDMGHSVTEAGRARDALARLQDRSFDILLTDLGLPDMGGAELARKVLEHQPDIGLVYATGEGHLPEGTDPRTVLLQKPYGEEDLRAALARAQALRPVHS